MSVKTSFNSCLGFGSAGFLVVQFGALALTSILALACASSHNSPPADPGATGTIAGGNSTAPVAVATAPTVASERGHFMDGCKNHGQAEQYCDCAFEQFRTVFNDSDLKRDIPKDDPRMKAFESKLRLSCASKVPESEAKSRFMSGCVSTDSRKAKYCECAWNAFRKQLDTAEIVAFDEKSTKWVDAKKKMVKSCKGTYPVALASAEFIQACTKGEATHAKYCNCAWKKINHQFSTEEIVAGTADVEKVKSLGQCR